MAKRAEPSNRMVRPINALRYFQEVARSGSIREASEVLNVAPSAISRQIVKIEDDIGVALFDRSTHGMRLTDAGRRYHDYVLSVTSALQELNEEISDLRGLRAGTIHVVSIEGLIAPVVSRAMTWFRKRYPEVAFTLEIVGAREVVRRLAAGGANIGLAFNAPTSVGIDYLVRHIDPIVAVLSPRHPLSVKTQLSLTEILAAPFAIPVEGFGIRDLVDQTCRNENLVLRPALETNSIDALRAFARNGDGVALLHRMAVAHEIEGGTLTSRPIESPMLSHGTVDVCVSTAFRPPPATRRFAEHVLQRLDVPCSEAFDEEEI